jgi:hypothetical protein
MKAKNNYHSCFLQLIAHRERYRTRTPAGHDRPTLKEIGRYVSKVAQPENSPGSGFDIFSLPI